VVLNYTATDALSFAVNGDVAQQDDAIAPGADADWHGVAGYANYQFTDQWRAALRGEWFDDEDGFRTSVAQQWKEVTGTSAYMPTEAGRYAPKRAATGRTKTASWTLTAASVTANTRLI
jgi:Putative beta-barrel porin-2, OmpL-like. bbp2